MLGREEQNKAPAIYDWVTKNGSLLEDSIQEILFKALIRGIEDEKKCKCELISPEYVEAWLNEDTAKDILNLWRAQDTAEKVECFMYDNGEYLNDEEHRFFFLDMHNREQSVMNIEGELNDNSFKGIYRYIVEATDQLETTINEHGKFENGEYRAPSQYLAMSALGMDIRNELDEYFITPFVREQAKIIEQNLYDTGVYANHHRADWVNDDRDVTLRNIEAKLRSNIIQGIPLDNNKKSKDNDYER